MRIDPNDPRLTAYALGELNEADRTAFERDLAQDPAAQEEVATIRAAATQLTEDLQDEPCPRLAPEQRVLIHAQLLPAESSGGFSWKRLFWTTGIASATGLLLVLLLLPGLLRLRERARHSLGQQTVVAGDDDADPFAAYRDVEYAPSGPAGTAYKVPIPDPADRAHIIGMESAPEPAVPAAEAETYATIRETGFQAVTKQPLSTFGLDVDRPQGCRRDRRRPCSHRPLRDHSRPGW